MAGRKRVRPEPQGETEDKLQRVAALLLNLTENVAAIRSGTPGPSRSAITPPLPPFDPTDATTSIEKFLNNIEQLADVHGWDESTVIYNTTSNLRGLAKTWYNSLHRLDYSWEEWKTLLMETFPDQNDYEALLNKMLQRVKKTDENMLTYYYEKLALINACDITGERAVSLLIGGLRTTNLQPAARAGGHKTPQSLLQFLKACNDIPQPMQSRTTPRLMEKKKWGKRFEPSTKVRCFTCNGWGHKSPQCPQRKPKPQKPSNVLATTSNKVDQNSKFFVHAYIEGIKVDAYVDFGSSVMTIQQQVANNLGLTIRESTECIKGYGGGVVKAVGTTDPIKIRIQQCEVKLKFLVVPDSVQNVAIIVGQPFTERDGFAIYKDENELRFLIKKPTQTKCTLRAIGACIIPPNYTSFVKCTGDRIGDVYLDGSVRLKEGEECEVPRCVLTISNTRDCRVPIVNLSNQDIVINDNQVVARGQSCTLEDQDELPASNNFAPLKVEELNLGEGLTNEQRESLLTLLNKYRRCFATNLQELGCATDPKMSITLTSDRPVTYRPYRMAHTEREMVKGTISELKEAGIIRDSESPYASPILLVSKPNGEKRLCIDYRKLNAITQKDRYPLPLIDDQIDQLRNQKYFTTLDLYSGYYQIQLEEESKNKTAFVTCDGHYEFNRMPFGLTNAPSVFQRKINRMLGSLPGLTATAYLDDIVCPGKTFEEAFENLEKILKSLEENKLTLNPRKCHFFKTCITYLGFEISEKGVKPGETKITAVKNFPQPKTSHNVRQFLGLTGFFRRFIAKYAQLTKPLTKLLKKEAPWEWSEDQQRAFDKLKQLLTERPTLTIFDPHANTEIHTDASQIGISGIMLQCGQEGILKPVYYFSRTLSPAESKWHSYELETLAVLETLKRFRVYLVGKPFKVITDCQSLKMASEKRNLVPRIARWWLQLQEFNFEVQHRPGHKMAHVDALSRNPVENQEELVENFVYRIETADWILAGQLTDKHIQFIHDILQKKNPKDDYEKKIFREYRLVDSRVYRVLGEKELWIVPKGMRREVLRANHDELGHFSVEKTIQKLLENYWFPNMRQYVQKYIATCIRCLYHKKPKGKKEGYLNPIPKGNIPFDTLHMDHLGPFNTSSGGKKYILVIVDGFTKFTFLHAVKDTKTAPVIKFLKQIFMTYGVPARMITDRGTAFTSRNFGNFCQERGINHIQNAVATPRANGQVERFNSTVLSALSTSVSEERQWEKKLPEIQFAINNTVNSTTGKSASQLLMGYQPRHSADSILTLEVGRSGTSTQHLQQMREEVESKVKERQIQQKKTFDKKRKRPKHYEPKDLALVLRSKVGEGSKKLLPNYRGPFRITKKLPNDRYVVSELEGSYRSQRAPFKSVEAVDHLKPWTPIGGVSSSEEEDNNSLSQV